MIRAELSSCGGGENCSSFPTVERKRAKIGSVLMRRRARRTSEKSVAPEGRESLRVSSCASSKYRMTSRPAVVVVEDSFAIVERYEVNAFAAVVRLIWSPEDV